MKKIYIFIFILIFFSFNLEARAESLGKKLSGKILLNVEKNGEAWYVNPKNNYRYYLGRPDDAFRIMRELGLGIKNEYLAMIEPSEKDKLKGPAVAGEKISNNMTVSESNNIYNKTLSKELSGKILIQVENNGEAWYICPENLKRYYLGRPADAFRIMRELSLGITKEDLAKIHKPGLNESINEFSKYERKNIEVNGKNFKADIIEIDLSNPKLKIITETADDFNCKSNCQAKSLASYTINNNGFAGINGSYFCDSSGCGARNYFFFPVFNTNTGKLINEDQLKYWTTGPIMAFDINNNFYYFKDSRYFKDKLDLTSSGGPYINSINGKIKLQAAIGNKPRLIEEGMNYLIDWELDNKQTNGVSLKNSIAISGKKINLVSVHNATIPELADVLQTLKIDYAINLDGGGSSALYYNDEYMVGPGRNIPNAIIFKEE